MKRTVSIDGNGECFEAVECYAVVIDVYHFQLFALLQHFA
jgi:hypothetical protein